jgi:hypothetical protein
MPFYVLTNQSKGLYLSIFDEKWTPSLRFGKVFTGKTAARVAIRQEWQAWCSIQRIPRLPDRIPRPAGVIRAKAGSDAINGTRCEINGWGSGSGV